MERLIALLHHFFGAARPDALTCKSPWNKGRRPSTAPPAGSVTVAAGSLVDEDGAEIASTIAGRGIGGNIAVTAGSEIVLSGPGRQITAFRT
jgi:hypothetical protein